MSKTISGKKAVKILSRTFGFYFVSQKGSHVRGLLPNIISTAISRLRLRSRQNCSTDTLYMPHNFCFTSLAIWKFRYESLFDNRPVKLSRQKNGKEIITIVPLHRELAIGTLKGILELAQIDEKEFWRAL